MRAFVFWLVVLVSMGNGTKAQRLRHERYEAGEEEVVLHDDRGLISAAAVHDEEESHRPHHGGPRGLTFLSSSGHEGDLLSAAVNHNNNKGRVRGLITAADVHNEEEAIHWQHDHGGGTTGGHRD